MIVVKEIIRKCRLCREIVKAGLLEQYDSENQAAVAISLAGTGLHQCSNLARGLTDVVGFTIEEKEKE